MTVISSATLANGLRTEFVDTYTTTMHRQADSRLASILDGIGATNRQHEFAYYNAPPGLTYWKRGNTIPVDAFDSVQFTVPVYEWGRRIPWSKWDRKDDQTSSLMEVARYCGESAAVLPEELTFDVINGSSPLKLPAIPLAPDGAALYATTAGGSNRFAVSSGNLLTGTGVASTATIQADYYSAIEQFGLFQDGKGYYLLRPDIISQGAIIVHAMADTQAFHEAFYQLRQGRVLGTDAGTTPSNVIIDSARNVDLWGTPRIATGDWYIFLKAAPKKPFFLLDREGLQEFQAIEGDNNSDSVRDTAIEYVQWELRQGIGVALPYATIKINN